jgi:hypothetical protein
MPSRGAIMASAVCQLSLSSNEGSGNKWHDWQCCAARGLPCSALKLSLTSWLLFVSEFSVFPGELQDIKIAKQQIN